MPPDRRLSRFVAYIVAVHIDIYKIHLIRRNVRVIIVIVVDICFSKTVAINIVT